jgi:hypothetical protein
MPFSRGSQLRSDPCQGASGGVFRAQNPHFSPTRFHEDPVLISQDSELDIFKREIDLRQFAVSLGYELDRRESWRGSTVLRSGGDKIVVKRNGNGHYVFFSVRDER